MCWPSITDALSMPANADMLRIAGLGFQGRTINAEVDFTTFAKACIVCTHTAARRDGRTTVGHSAHGVLRNARHFICCSAPAALAGWPSHGPPTWCWGTVADHCEWPTTSVSVVLHVAVFTGTSASRSVSPLVTVHVSVAGAICHMRDTGAVLRAGRRTVGAVLNCPP
jgi:hypothetical protein